MASTIGPKINIVDYISDGSTYGDIGRTFLRMFQALIQANVINMTTSTPPGSPSDGDTYIVDPTGSGTWVGKNNYIAYWTLDDPNNPSGVWEFYQPLTGWIVGNQADQLAYIYNGSTWTSLSGSGGAGLNTQTTLLSAAQIKALNATPILVCSAPGANKANIPVSITLQIKPGSTPFNSTATYRLGTLSTTTYWNDYAQTVVNDAAAIQYVPPCFFGSVRSDYADINNRAYYFMNTTPGTDATVGNGQLNIVINYVTVTLI